MNLLEHRRARRVLFALLYFSEGAPIGFVWWALPTILREAGTSIENITALTALLTLVWGLKLLWAPLVDVVRGPRWTLRAWIVTSQIAMVATILSLLWIDPAQSLGLLAVVLTLHALAAATQDVSIDALAIRSTTADERGSINGWMQAGMLLGRSAFGGGALIVRNHYGDRAVVLLLACAITVTLAAALFFRDTTSATVERVPLGHRIRDLSTRLGIAVRRRCTWLGLAFAATGGVAFEAVGALAGPFLVDREIGSDIIGWFFALPSVVCMLAGALLGGYLSDRAGRRRTVVAASVWIAVTVLLLALLDGPLGVRAPTALLGVLSSLYAGIGLFTASSYALFMDLTDRELGSTQFSAFMGATNLCETWAVLVVGMLVTSASYSIAFATMALLSLCALPLVAGLRATSAQSTSAPDARA